MKGILVICVVLAAFSSESFSQSIDLTPRVTPVKGDTLFTWNQAQAKEIGVLLSERNSFRSELNLNDSLMGVYRSQVGELTHLNQILAGSKKSAIALYKLESEKAMSCNADRVSLIDERDKLSGKLSRSRFRQLVAYSIAGILLAAQVLIN
jgi:hypothetical protein